MCRFNCVDFIGEAKTIIVEAQNSSGEEIDRRLQFLNMEIVQRTENGAFQGCEKNLSFQ